MYTQNFQPTPTKVCGKHILETFVVDMGYVPDLVGDKRSVQRSECDGGHLQFRGAKQHAECHQIEDVRLELPVH